MVAGVGLGFFLSLSLSLSLLSLELHHTWRSLSRLGQTQHMVSCPSDEPRQPQRGGIHLV